MAIVQSLPPGAVRRATGALPAGAVRRGEAPPTVEEEEEDFSLAGAIDATGQAASSGLSGLGESFGRSIYGAMDWAGVDVDDAYLLDKERRAEALATMKEEADKSGFGTAGRLAGDVSKFALPGALATKAGLGLKAIAAAEVLGSGGIGSLKTPEQGKSRLTNAAKEAALASAGLGFGKVLEKSVRGLSKMPGAEEYMRAGNYLTPGQAASNPTVRGVESTLSIMPFVARATDELRDQGVAGFTKSTINMLAKNLDSAVKELPTGQAGMRRLRTMVENGYDAAWDAVDDAIWATTGRGSFINDVATVANDWAETEAKALIRLSKTAARGGLKQADKKIRDMMTGAEGDFLEELKALRVSLRQKAGPGTVDQLAKMDSQYGPFLTVQKAMAKNPQFNAKELTAAAKRVGGEAQAAQGLAPLQKGAQEMADVLEPFDIGLMQSMGKISKTLPSPIPRTAMKKMGDMAMGETNTQRVIQKWLEDDEVRKNLIPILGALFTGDSE